VHKRGALSRTSRGPWPPVGSCRRDRADDLWSWKAEGSENFKRLLTGAIGNVSTAGDSKHEFAWSWLQYPFGWRFRRVRIRLVATARGSETVPRSTSFFFSRGPLEVTSATFVGTRSASLKMAWSFQEFSLPPSCESTSIAAVPHERQLKPTLAGPAR